MYFRKTPPTLDDKSSVVRVCRVICQRASNTRAFIPGLACWIIVLTARRQRNGLAGHLAGVNSLLNTIKPDSRVLRESRASVSHPRGNEIASRRLSRGAGGKTPRGDSWDKTGTTVSSEKMTRHLASHVGATLTIRFVYFYLRTVD